MESCIISFAKRMQAKLDKNRFKESAEMNPDGKGRTWKSCHLDWLLFRLRQETMELDEALIRGDFDAVLDEAADVGNFAMMIHDNLGG